MIVTEYIEKSKFRQFHEIICNTGGRYLDNPFPLWKTIMVRYEPGDYKKQCDAWERINKDIKEIRKDQLWRKFIRRYLKFKI